MRRFSLLLLALVLGLLLTFALIVPIASQGQPLAGSGPVRVTQVDTSTYPQVSIFAAVSDPAGAPRGDLSRADFQIVEDGAPVELTDFVGAGGSSISTALVIDRSLSMEDADKIAGARAAADAFVSMLRPGDQAALIGFNDRVRTLEPFTADQAELHAAIARLRPAGGTALYDSVIAGVDLLRDQPGRRALLVLTDGQDCRDIVSCPADAGSAHSLRDAIDYAAESGQAVYVIGLGDRSSGGDDGVDEGVLRQLASGTEGSYYYSPDAADLTDLYTALAGSLQGEYRLSYVSPRPFYDGTRRDIVVMVAGERAGAGCTERHLINVTSSPLVGAALLLPLLGLLLLPGWVAARRARGVAAGPAGSGGALPVAPEVIVVAPEVAPAAATSSAGARCTGCDAPLRPGARFCGRCGASQPAPAPAAERRAFCDMCGRPLLPAAGFCTACGEPVRQTQDWVEDASARGAHR